MRADAVKQPAEHLADSAVSADQCFCAEQCDWQFAHGDLSCALCGGNRVFDLQFLTFKIVKQRNIVFLRGFFYTKITDPHAVGGRRKRQDHRPTARYSTVPIAAANRAAEIALCGKPPGCGLEAHFREASCQCGLTHVAAEYTDFHSFNHAKHQPPR